jgi:hypothetical protein
MDDSLQKEKAMRPKKRSQWFRHDEGNARELKAQQEWKISLIVRQRVAGLEKKVADLEKRMDEAAVVINDDLARLPNRVRGIILDAMKPLPPLPPTKTLTILGDNIKTRRPRKKGKK